MIGVFLALLELVRQKKILVTQSEDLTEVQIEIAPEEHRKTYQEQMEEVAPAPPPEAAAPTDAE